ncbi:hypothetical protein Tco_0422144, partial [Tanacetum coccineum]
IGNAILLEDKQILSVGVFDEVFSIWKAFGGNTRDFGSFGEETDETTDLHQHCSRISPQKLETTSQGKENGVNILKSIDEGPFQMGTFRVTLAEGNEGALYLGETIHDYYGRFTKLINEMRNIKMTMPRMQLNLKFVNNMLPEWGRFVTAVKLNRELKESNYDQLYAYLKQHEAHANENKMMLERFT